MKARPWLVLAVLGLAQLMLVLDATVVNVALPRAQSALGFSDGDRQWVITAYSLAFGSLLLIGGRLADLYGRRRVFLTGLVGFAAASAVGGVAPSFGVLVASRALQGGFSAVLAPSALSFLTTTFSEPASRSRAFGVFGAISAAGSSVGLMLGGALTEYLDWRWVMYVNVVIAGIALLGSLPLLPQEAAAPRRTRLDLPGTVLAAGGVFAIVFGFAHAATRSGLSAALDASTLWSVGVGVALLAGFAQVERRATHPLLPLRIVRDRDRGGAYAAMFLSAVGVFGVLLFLTYYLQSTLGYSPVEAGLAFLPMSATLVVVGGVGTGMLATRVSPRTMVPIGLLTAGVGMAMLTQIGPEPRYAAVVLPATVVAGVGLGLVFAPCFNLATLGVAEADTGVASATVHVAQQVGGSIGTALLNTIATTVAGSFATGRGGGAAGAQAAVDGYAAVFWVSAAAFGVAAAVVAAFLHPVDRRANRLAWANPVAVGASP